MTKVIIPISKLATTILDRNPQLRFNEEVIEWHESQSLLFQPELLFGSRKEEWKVALNFENERLATLFKLQFG